MSNCLTRRPGNGTTRRQTTRRQSVRGLVNSPTAN